jgi:hypothetical protein
VHFLKNEFGRSREFHLLADSNACRRILPELQNILEAECKAKIAGDPELIESTDDSAGNRIPSSPRSGAGGESWSMDDRLPIHESASIKDVGLTKSNKDPETDT